MIQSVRRELFHLMLKRDTCSATELLGVLTEIELKIDLLVSLTGLERRRVDVLLDQQYTDWLAEGAHGRDEPGAKF